MERKQIKSVCDGLKKNYQGLLRYAIFLVHNLDDARDLLQETALAALMNADKYEEKGSFYSWATQIMKNIFINREKKRLIRNSFGYDDISPDDFPIAVCEADEDCCYREISNFIATKLPASQANALSLVIKGYSYAEIADGVGRSVGSVKKYLSAARAALRKKFGN